MKLLCDHDITTAVTTLGVGDTFVEHGTVAELRSLCGINAEAVYDALKR